MSTDDTEYKFVDFGKRRGFDQIAPDHLIKMIDDNLIEQKQTVNIIRRVMRATICFHQNLPVFMSFNTMHLCYFLLRINECNVCFFWFAGFKCQEL